MTTEPNQQITPTLYIIVRRDIPSMNPGKAMAQVAHAQADFDQLVGVADCFFQAHGLIPSRVREDLAEWKEDRTFGRTLVLSGTLEEIREITDSMVISGVTIDPTYPWQNYYGDTFLSSEVTCGYIFVADSTITDLSTRNALTRLKNLSLHR